MSAATQIRIDLGVPYWREFAADILAGIAADLSDRVGSEGLAGGVPAADRMFTCGFDVVGLHIEDLERLDAITSAIALVSSDENQHLDWSFGREELINGAARCAILIRDELDALGDIVGPSEEFLAWATIEVAA